MDDYRALVSRMEDLEKTNADLRERFGRLEDESEIGRIQRMYGYYIDNRMWDAMTDLFAEDGSIEIGRRGRYIGKERVRALLRDVIGRGRDGLLRGEIINHMQLQGVVTVDPGRETAKGRWRALIQGSPPPGETTMVWAEGVYENTYVRERGQWKISSLWWAPTFYVNIPGYESVYFDSSPADEAIPPDTESIPQHAVLGRSFVPFHYRHPVSGKSVELDVLENSTDHIGYRMKE